MFLQSKALSLHHISGDSTSSINVCTTTDAGDFDQMCHPRPQGGFAPQLVLPPPPGLPLPEMSDLTRMLTQKLQSVLNTVTNVEDLNGIRSEQLPSGSYPSPPPGLSVPRPSPNAADKLESMIFEADGFCLASGFSTQSTATPKSVTFD